jgi:hypothetical protein
MNAIRCYAPTNYHDEESKYQFYNRQQAVLDKLKDKDINILMGDLNAKVGSDNRGYKKVMGHALGEMNENGKKNRRPLWIEQPCHRRQHLRLQEDTQSHLGIVWTCHRKSNRPPLYRQEVQTISSTRASEKGSRRSIRSPPSDCETETEENRQAGRTKYNVNRLKEQTNQTAFTLSLKNIF